MKYQQELLSDVWDAVYPLLQLHYEELTLHKDVVKLAPKWVEYEILETAGLFALFTARADDGQLVGYNAFFLNTHMHYAGLFMAVNDVFYIRDDYRHGSTALRLLRFSETALKRLGAQKVVYHCKAGNNFATILRSRLLGYSDEEAVVGKII